MKYDDLPYDMSLEEIYAPRDADPHDSSLDDDDEYMEEEIVCCRCGRKGPRYEIQDHICSEAA